MMMELESNWNIIVVFSLSQSLSNSLVSYGYKYFP